MSTNIANVFAAAASAAKSEAEADDKLEESPPPRPDVEKMGGLGASVTTMSTVAKFAKKLPRQEYSDVLSFSEVHRTGTFLTLVVPLVLVLAALLVPAYCVPLVVDGEVPTAQIFLPVGLACLVVFPLLMFLKWIGKLMLDSFDFDDHFAETEAESKGRFDCLKPSVPLSCLSLAILLRQANYLVDISWSDTPYVEFYKLLLNLGTAMAFFIASVSGLDSLHQSVEKFGRRLDGIARNKRSHKWYMIMRKSRSFQDHDKDGSARIPGGHRSPPQVLADIVGIYCNIAKMASLSLLVLFFLDFDITSNLVVLGLALIFAGIIKKLDLQNAMVNVLALSMSNTVHVGELISLGKPGSDPPDNPGKCITGFFEGCTWGHVIIRDFGRKPIYIRHDEFRGLSVSNWSRRPNKCCQFRIPVVAELSGGTDRLAKLAEYTKDWMKRHPSIDQDCYKKSLVKWTSKGLVLDVIFYPAMGGNANALKAEFTVVLLDAAKRLNLCLMPAEIRATAPWSTSADYEFVDAVDFSDLNPSPELSARAGFKPKNIPEAVAVATDD